MGQGANIHETEAELFYVIDGAGTLLTGGKLIDERRTNAENEVGPGSKAELHREFQRATGFCYPQANLISFQRSKPLDYG